MADFEKLLMDLMELGFTEYEARTYIALLGNSHVNRHKLSKLANIPTAKIYDTVDRLVERGFIAPVDSSDRPEYIALAPEEIIQQIRTQTNLKLKFVETKLKELEDRSENNVRPLTWNLEGSARILQKSREVIARAQETIICAIWEQEMETVLPDLREAQERGVEIVLLGYGDVPMDLGMVHRHGMEETLIEQTGGRWLTLVAEAEREVVIGYFPESDVATGVWAQSSILAMITEKYIREHFLSHGIDLFQSPLEGGEKETLEKDIQSQAH